MILQRHFSNMYLKERLKRKFLLSLFLFSNLFGSEDSYLKHNFLDESKSYISSGYLEAFSSKLSFDIFEDDWIEKPLRDKDNYAFGTLYYDLYYNDATIKYGIFKEKSANVYINDGFIDTWYSSGEDFTVLLRKSTIKDELDTIDIKGELSSYNTNGIFIQKIIDLKKHHISIKTKLFTAKELQDIKTSGYNNNNRFELDIYYYYSNKNIITKNDMHDDSYKGLGVTNDVEYIYKDDKLYLYMGVYNIFGYIDWDSITYMYYHFDSNTVYVGDDGYNHTRAFGNGYYKFDTSYHQTLPRYYKGSINYKYNLSWYIGDNIIANDYEYYNELYTIYSYDKNLKYKLGYFIENSTANFGIYYKNISLEVSNKFGSNDTLLNTSYKVVF